jgi:hypothetical protein
MEASFDIGPIEQTLRQLWSSMITDKRSSEETRLHAAESLSSYYASAGNFPDAANALQAGLAMCRQPEIRARLHFALAKLYSKHKSQQTWLALEQTGKALKELDDAIIDEPRLERQIRRLRAKLEQKMRGGGWFSQMVIRLGLTPIGPVMGAYLPLPSA